MTDCGAMNFAREVLQAQPPERLALVELTREGRRREWTFGEVDERSTRMAGALVERGVQRGDVVMTLIGNRAEWVLAMMASFRIGAVVLPCTEQLRAKDLRLRLNVTRPTLIVADERNRDQVEAATPDCDVMWVGDEALWAEGTSRGGIRTDHAQPGHTPPGGTPPGETPRDDTPRGETARDDTAREQTPPDETPRGNASQTGRPTRTRGVTHFGAHTTHRPPPSSVSSATPTSTTPTGPTGPNSPEAPELGDGATAPPPYAELADNDPALITFTSGTAGEPKAVVHAQRYLHGQRVQAEQWLGAKQGELVWCTAASGWSKSARNVFIAPWLMGASALLHDARFDPHERLDIIERERVTVLCMAPTEYRVIAKRATLRALPSLKGMVAAGEALNPEVLKVWRDATGLDIRDGYGQTETGQMTGMGIGVEARAGSMGRALEGVRLSVIDGELVADPRSVPTFFLGYLGEEVRRQENGSWTVEDRRDGGAWPTGDRVGEDTEGYLHFEGRSDDVIISAGYRIGPFEVESALVAHQAVAEAAAVATPDEERGAVVRAIVVLRDGYEPSKQLASELQEHVKRETAPYKYPRIVEFATELPKTASGKIKRAALRGDG
jgi:acyl-coenzyme A synthetase/AMP-(fatty) acid ligase